MSRIRVASAQYFIRPVETFEQFRDQIAGLVETAWNYDCQLVVFPEYFTVQLLTLNDYKRPIPEQIRTLASFVPRFVQTLSELAQEKGLYIAAGTIPVLAQDGTTMTNEAFFFSPSGKHAVQGKMHMTRFESESWGITPDTSLKVFETDFGNVSILVCYDVEFPELAREAARRGVYVLIVPSWTDDRNGFLRVRYCAHARCVENQLYVIHSATVGSLPMVPAISLNYGQAAILTPLDYPFARDGILFDGIPNQETLVIGDIDLAAIEEARASGTVLPLRDSQRSREVAENLEVVALPGARPVAK